MAYNTKYCTLEAFFITILLVIPNVLSDDASPIPADKGAINGWFSANVPSKGTLDPALVTAEAGRKVITVKSGGGGDFKTIGDAVKSVPVGNTNRIIISIGPGTYAEKVKIDRMRPFITLHGDPSNMPIITYGDTAAKTGTVESATVIVEADYFSAVNLVVKNSAPRPDGKKTGQQAVAFRLGGDKSSVYNCKFHGFQDTLCDYKGMHFYKDCYIEGTVDFIFGYGKSIFLNTELHVIPGDRMAMITAQARKQDADNGFVFAHCKVTGTGGYAMLGRAWMPYAKVVYAFTEMSDAVHPEGWSNNFQPNNEKTVYFGEYNNKGVGAAPDKRAKFTQSLTADTVKPFITLAYIQGSKWLLPPASV